MREPGLVVGRIAGVAVRVRLGGLLLPAAITWLLSTQLLPAVDPAIAAGVGWSLGLAGAVFFECGVVGHEVAHAVVARRAGLRADVADLRLFGGVTVITGEVRRPRDQLRIAGIGPAFSLGYATLVGFLTVLVRVAHGPAALVALGGYVAVASAAVGLVNLLPGAPLDGGRVLQAWAWHRCGDRRRAGLTAARAGRWVAGLLIAAGIAATAGGLLGLLSGATLVVMGVMAWFGAGEEWRELTGAGPAEREPEPELDQRR